MPASNDHDADLDRLVDEAARAWLQEREATLSDHPETETLIAFQEGRLPGEEAEAVRRHVEACEDCREEVLALERFDAAEVDEEASDEVALRRSWQTFAARRERELPPPAGRSGTYRPLAIAATLLLAVAGVGGFVLLTQPGAGDTPLVFDLPPDGSSLLREAGGSQEVVVPPEVDTLVPRLEVGDQTPYDRFELTLTDAAGEVVVRQGDAVRDAEGRFALLVPRRLVDEGSYRVTLAGLSGSERVEIAVYSFRLSDAP